MDSLVCTCSWQRCIVDTYVYSSEASEHVVTICMYVWREREIEIERERDMH